MGSLCHRVAIALVAIPMIAVALPFPGDYWQSHADVAGRTNGYRRGAGVHLFMPLLQDESSLVFNQAMGGNFYKNWTGSVGMGYRQILSPVFAWGINGFVDVARSEYKHVFAQGGLGLELFGQRWEFRANGYLPFSGRRSLATNRDCELFLVDLEVFKTEADRFLREHPYSGFDVEAGMGYDLVLGALWVYGGYFNFQEHQAQTVAGPRVKIEYRVAGLMGVPGAEGFARAEWEYNRVNHSYTTGVIGVRIPLGRPTLSSYQTLSSMYHRLGERVRRAESILIRAQEKRVFLGESVVLTPDLDPLQVIFIDGGVGGTGTREDPTDVTGAELLGHPFDFIVALNDAGPIVVPGTFNLKEAQTLIGFGDSETLVLTADGCTLTLEDDSGRAVLTRAAGADVVTLANRTTVQGLRIENGNDSIGTAFAVSGVTIRDMELFDPAIDGVDIAFAGSQANLIENVEIDLAGFGIDMVGNNNTIRNARVMGPGAEAIQVTAGTNLLIEDCFITTTSAEAIFISAVGGNVTIRRNTIEDITGSNIAIEMPVTTNGIYRVVDNIITGTGDTTTDTALDMTVTGAVDVEIEFSRNTVRSIDLNAINITQAGTGGTLSLVADSNTISIIDLADAFFLDCSTSTSGSTYAFCITNNTFTACDSRAMRINCETNGALPVTMQGTILNNTFTDIGALSTAGEAILIDTNMDVSAGHTFTTLIERNTFRECDDQAVSVIADPASTGTLNITMKDNSDALTTGVDPAYSVNKTAATFVGTLCLTMNGNNSDRTTGILLNNTGGGGTFEVTDLADLSSDNNDIPVSITGTGTIVNRTTPCPLPPSCGG